MKSDHPWREKGRGVRTVDPVAYSRSGQYAAYLATLPPPERQRLEAAERLFVARSGADGSEQLAAARDFDEGMLGLREKDRGRGIRQQVEGAWRTVRLTDW